MQDGGDGVRTRRAGWVRAVAVLAIVVIAILPRMGIDPTSGVAADAAWPTFASYLETSIPRRMDAFDVPDVAVALFVDGEPVWTGAYGDADRARGRPMTVDTYLRTESISKSVTAWGVVRLAELGLVDLDDPVARHLRTWAFPAPTTRARAPPSASCSPTRPACATATSQRVQGDLALEPREGRAHGVVRPCRTQDAVRMDY